MEILNQKEAINQLANLAYDKKLIPIFGAGFSMGCVAHKERVLDGDGATNIMKNLLVSKCKISMDEIDDLDFNDTSKMFQDNVPEEYKQEFYRNYFTEVKLTKERKEFLEVLDWPYAYTLNIDDGIERTGLFKEVLPYKNLKRPTTSLKRVFKLHGDAYSELNYDEESIVFSSDQYIKAITAEENRDFLNNLKADFTEKNILFIGCSLLNEPDISYIYTQVEKKVESTLRITLRTNAPTLKEISKLKRYGINEVIVIEDFEVFYRDLIREYRELLGKDTVKGYKFVNPTVKRCNNKDNSLKYFSGIRIFDENKNIFYKTNMHIYRECIEEIETGLNSCGGIILKGRRFSGKSFILASICEKFSKYRIYFFPSTCVINEYELEKILKDAKNSLFIFDSNSLSSASYLLFANSLDKFNKDNNKFILAVNSNDSYMTSSQYATLVEIPNTFRKQELVAINAMADKNGLIRRFINSTNLDYIHEISKKQKIQQLMSRTYNVKLFSKHEKIILVLLCALDKAYVGDLIALNITYAEKNEFLSKLPLVVEEVKVEREEYNQHSGTKLVHNGRRILLDLLKEISPNDIVECIDYIVDMLKDDKERKRMYTEIILFDTLNQLFGGNKGAGHLIFRVYESLEQYLNSSPHYWLQRAKSIYRILPYNKEKLEEAYRYAKKCYNDSWKNLQTKAALTTSLICCLLSEQINDINKKQEFEIEAINLAEEAIFSPYYVLNRKFLDSELKNTKNSYMLITAICSKYINNKEKKDISNKAKKIYKKLKEEE